MANAIIPAHVWIHCVWRNAVCYRNALLLQVQPNRQVVSVAQKHLVYTFVEMSIERVEISIVDPGTKAFPDQNVLIP